MARIFPSPFPFDGERPAGVLAIQSITPLASSFPVKGRNLTLYRLAPSLWIVEHRGPFFQRRQALRAENG